jgi:hypothetical protein
MASYDDWRSTEPDEPWARGQRCATPGCDNWVTFPDMENHCTNCLVEQERQREQLKRQSELVEVQVKR